MPAVLKPIDETVGVSEVITTVWLEHSPSDGGSRVATTFEVWTSELAPIVHGTVVGTEMMVFSGTVLRTVTHGTVMNTIMEVAVGTTIIVQGTKAWAAFDVYEGEAVAEDESSGWSTVEGDHNNWYTVGKPLGEAAPGRTWKTDGGDADETFTTGTTDGGRA